MRDIRWIGLMLLMVGAVACGAGRTGENALGDTTPPRVTTAGATSNTTVVVTFSEAMQGGLDSTENPEHYTISSVGATKANRVVAQAVVGVKAAVLSADKTSVTLTTFPLSEVDYLLVVTQAKDLAGNQIAAKDRAGNANEAKFAGKPGSGLASDTDGDGLSDSLEQAGWQVVIKKGTAETSKRAVTSDPTVADTDSDGLSDSEEKTYGTDPRAADTDGDAISDYKELTYIYSEPANSDTDADTLNDSLEFDFFKSSPNDKDTDGDQITDDQEINLANRNPRVADIPVPSIEVGNVDLRLDVKFTKTNTSGQSESKTKNVTSNLVQTDNQKFSQSDARTNEFMANLTVGTEWEAKLLSFGAKGTFSAEAQTTNTWNSSFTTESTKETQKSYQDSLESGFEQSVEDSVTRELQGGSIKATINLKNQSNVAFSMSDLQVTVFFQDPEKPDKLLPIGTLKPAVDKYNFGVNEKKDNQVFEAPAGSIFAATLEALMENPQGLIFKVSNYNITDESNRNFAFTSQAINDRTAPIVLDYDGFDSDGDGEGDNSERLRVATSAGRILTDINADGKVDDKDRILYDKSGVQVGITMREVLEGIMRLKAYDEDQTPSGSLSGQEQQNSYSTKKVSIGGKQVEMLWRLRQVGSQDVAGRKFWAVLNNTGIDISQDFNPRIIKTEAGITLAFVQDLDGDRIPARLEYLKGCSDEQLDTDGDGVSDYDEEYRGWQVEIIGKGTYQAFSSCAKKDSDLDGLPDAQEKTLGTDPAKKDSDLDGVADNDEVNGYTIDYITGGKINVKTSPLKPDTDGDGVRDGVEKRLGGNPTVADRDLIADDDGDGLTNFRETSGWQVKTFAVSSAPGVQGVLAQALRKSDPKLKDTDSDGLSDTEENTKLTNPNQADTDGDGVADKTDTNPTDADMDDDLRSDGQEAVGCNGGNATSPTNPDSDGDTLYDGVECNTYGTNPTNPNTDGDGYRDDRDIAYGLNPKVQDQRVRVGLLSFDTLGDCDLDTIFEDALSGAAEFEGQVKLQRPDGGVEDIWNMTTNPNFPNTPKTHAGETVFTNAFRDITLTTNGAGFKIFSSAITEVDARTCCDTAVLGSISPEITGVYAVFNKNDSVSVGFDGCKVRFNYQITVYQ